MPKVPRKYNVTDDNGKSDDVDLVFGPMKAGYMKENRELLKTAVVKSSIDDLLLQIPIAEESLKRGGGSPFDFGALDIPDLADAIRASMEASGFSYGPVAVSKPGGDSPANK